MATKNKSQQVAARRLAKIRLADANALPGVKPTAHGNFHTADRYAILHAIQALKAKQAAAKAAKPKPAKPFDPLAPLSGKSFEKEVAARTKLEFSPEEAKLRDAVVAENNRVPVVSNAFDQYHQALLDARDRGKAASDAYVTQSQDAVNAAYTQDKAAQEARDKAAAAKAALIGQTGAATPSQGAERAEGARSQGNQAVVNERTAAGADNTMMEGRAATSLQAKATALQHEDDTKASLDRAAKELAGRKGAYAAAQRNDLSQTERTYALARKEFGLKAADTKSVIASRKAATKAAKQSTNAQVIVAKIYAASNKAQARAQVRVAKLQLDKGKIDQKQYRKIVNVYKGLPKKGTSPQAKPAAPKNPAGGSGAGGSLAPWEVDARDRAFTGFGKNQYTRDDHARAIVKAVQAGIPKRLAEAAWKRYVKTLHQGTVVANDGNGQQRPT